MFSNLISKTSSSADCCLTPFRNADEFAAMALQI